MIPKKLHYCWFGDRPLCQLSLDCMESWKEHCPDYEVMFWNENNIDLEDPFIAHHIEKKQWAFVSDYVRLQKLAEHGGVYLDTDFEVVRSLDPLLEEKCFLGEEKADRVNSGILGAEAGHPFPEQCLDFMRKRFESGQPYLIAPEVCTKVLTRFSGEINVFPPEFFYPYNPYSDVPGDQKLMFRNITDNTYAIHHWAKSWSMPLHLKVMRRVSKLVKCA
ncbi:MAG: glycosyltransferase [Verrucomicrobiales bacterium]|nr:glycosyltransferase [Verrucomicrobiales bacterium]